MPDKIFGEVPRVAIVLRPGMEAGEEEIREFCKGKLADFKVPTKVKFLEELPRNPGGKILKRVLSEDDIKAEGLL